MTGKLCKKHAMILMQNDFVFVFMLIKHMYGQWMTKMRTIQVTKNGE